MGRWLLGALLAASLLACAPPPAGAPPELAEGSSLVAEVAEVACEAEGARLLTPRVAAGPGGVRVHFTHPPPESGTAHGYATGWSVDGFGGAGGGSDPDGTTEQVLPLAPGRRSALTCSPPYEPGGDVDGGDPRWAVRPEVVDPGGVWREIDLGCAEVTEIGHPAGSEGPRARAGDLAEEALTGFFGSAADASAVRQLGYPDAAEPLYGIVRDGRVLARVRLQESGAPGQDLVVPTAIEHCDRRTWPAVDGGGEGIDDHPCPDGGTGALLDYVSFVQFDDRQYVEVDSGADEEQFDADELGEVVGWTLCQLSGTHDDTGYRPRDGDAAFLPPGTALHAVEGFERTFRLGAAVGDELLLFEVDSYAAGRRGADVLDIAGRVQAITINADAGSGDTAVGQITDPAEVERLVRMVLDAPLDLEDRPTDVGVAPRLFLDFELEGSPPVARAFWPDDDLLSRGIRVPEAFTAAITGAVRPGR